ncbi:MAG: ATP-binding protein [Nitrososphaerales archaeon]
MLRQKSEAAPKVKEDNHNLTLIRYLLAPSLPLFVISILSINYNGGVISETDHFYIASLAVVFGGTITVYCISRAFASNDKFYFFLGLGFAASTMIDLLDVAMSIGFVGEAPFLTYFVQQTWVIGRIMNASMILLVVAKYASLRITTKPISKDNHLTIAIPYGLMSIALIGFSLFAFLFDFMFDFPIERPYDLLPLGIFLAALAFFIKNRVYHTSDVLHRAIGIYLIMSIFGEIIVSQSALNFDIPFYVSDLLRDVSYFTILIALVVSNLQYTSSTRARADATEIRYKTLYEGSADLYTTIDTDKIIQDCNKSYAAHLGYSKEELIGRSIYETTATKSFVAMRESFETWKERGSVFNREVWLKRKDGTIFPALISVTNLFDENGKLIGGNTIIKDISEIYEAAQALEQANKELAKLIPALKSKEEALKHTNEELKHKDRLKDEFISIASHELRTPVQIILGYAELAKEGTIAKEETWNEVIQNAYRLQRLTNDILDASRIDSGSLKYFIQKVNINGVILEVVNNAKLNLNDKVSIETKLDKDIMIEADRDRISQALTNIIGNASKFTKEGTIKVESHVLYEKNRIEIKISDNGGGIPDDILPNLFGKFVTKSVQGGTQHGTGLGLYISKAIVIAHKGEISAYNNNENGATFSIVLPIHKTQIE